MPPQTEPHPRPDPVGPRRAALLRQRRQQRLRTVLIVAVLLVLAGLGTLAWNKWDRHVAEAPPRPVGHTIASQAKPGDLGIAVTGLIGDTGGTYANLLRDSLAKYDGVELKTITPPVTLATDPTGLVKSRTDAPDLLEHAGADALVWGQVDRTNGNVTLQLYWTEGPGAASTHFYEPDGVIALPALPWDMVRPVLGLLVQSRVAAQGLEMTAHYPAGRVTPLLDEVRGLRRDFAAIWSPETAASIDMVFAEALRDTADQTNDTAGLNESIAAYREVLTLRTRDQSPLGWAAAEDGLGLALTALGRRDTTPEHLESALSAYQQALQERTREHAPLQWAATERHLGDAYRTLGQREAGLARLSAAALSYRNALSAEKRELAPLDWATTQDSLGLTLQLISARQRPPAQLAEAAAAYRQALQERSPKLAPMQWAASENNLGTTLVSLSRGEAGTSRLKEAVAAYENALLQRARERVPLEWAETEDNLGNALTLLGGKGTGTDDLELAVAAYRQALLGLTREASPDNWARIESTLGFALTKLAERTKGPKGNEQLQDAIKAYDLALQVRTRDKSLGGWVTCTGGRGVAMMMLAQRTHDTAQAAAAVQQIDAALGALHDAGVTSGAVFFRDQLVKAKAVVVQLNKH